MAIFSKSLANLASADRLASRVLLTSSSFLSWAWLATTQTLALIASTQAASAYSLRKLNSDYTGAAIEVRRSSDNSTQNIGFTANGDLDTTALKTFVGSGNGFITIWYDQSGNARNAFLILKGDL